MRLSLDRTKVNIQCMLTFLPGQAFIGPSLKYVLHLREFKGQNSLSMISLVALMFAFLFKDCIGALEGTHIDCVTGDAEGQRFRNHKGRKSLEHYMCCSLGYDVHLCQHWMGRKCIRSTCVKG